MREAHEVDARTRARFWARVDRETTPEGCWPWTGTLNREGRGRFTVVGETTYAYRWSYVLERGPVTATDVVRHLCGNPACCRPDHLEVGGQRENNLDTAEQGRNRSAKLDGPKARRIRERSAAPSRPSRQELAREYGVSISAIGEVVTGRSWPHAGGPVQRRHPSAPNGAQPRGVLM